MIEKAEMKAAMTSDNNMAIIQNLANYLQLFADLSQSDVFIDCLLHGEEAAVVMAEAHPSNAPSLYKSPVTGQIALKEKEPGVFFCLTTGQSVIGSRGVSQENVDIQQNVIPIKNQHNETIAALIMEKDISNLVQQEKHVEFLIETTEQLSETLLHGAMDGGHSIPALIHEGLIIFNHHGMITFANDRAYEILKDFEQHQNLIGTNLEKLCFGKFTLKKITGNGGLLSEEFQRGSLYIQLKAVCIHRHGQPVGGILLLRDLSEIKEKEKQLMIKSAVIKEIHHRVKNNLQTIASLLRLQMRRSDSKEVEKVFRESINRIMSISIIHEVLSQDGLDAIDCKEIFSCVADGIVSSMKQNEQKISVSVQGSSLFLDSKKASSLALIINELVQNSLNHAFKGRCEGRISIQTKRSNLNIEIVVSDNGVGFEYHPELSRNLGLEICHTLVQEDLNGSLVFTHTGKGTDVTISFPIPKGEVDYE